MNRAQRRQAVKDLRKKGMAKEAAKSYVEQYFAEPPLDEGVKVQLNYEFMIRHPDWKRQRDDFKDWVTAHKDDVFTVEWDKARKEKDSKDKKFLVCLKEDTTEPKWLFHTMTLKPVATATIKLDSGEEMVMPLGKDGLKFDTKDVNAVVDEALQREKINIEKLAEAKEVENAKETAEPVETNE